MPFCAVKWCNNKSRISNYTTDGVTFHRFPKEPDRLDKWIASTGRPENWFPTKHSTICSTHFDKGFFYEHGLTRRLYETAVPTLNLPALYSTIPHESIDIKMDTDDDDDHKEDYVTPDSPKQQKLEETIEPNTEYQHESVEVKTETNSENDDVEKSSSSMQEKLEKTIDSNIVEIKKEDYNDHDYEKPTSPKQLKLMRVVSLNHCNHVKIPLKLKALKGKQKSRSLRGSGSLQPIAPKPPSARVIGSLTPITPKLGPGTLLPVKLKPMLSQPMRMPNNSNPTTLVGIQPIGQANFDPQHTTLMGIQHGLTTLFDSKQANLDQPTSLMGIEAIEKANLDQSNTVVGIKPIEQATLRPIAPKQVENVLNTPAKASAFVKNSFSNNNQGKGGSVKVITTPGPSQKIQNNKTKSIPKDALKMNKEMAMMRKIDYLKYSLEIKNKIIKRLQSQNKTWINEVKSLKIMVEALIKLKK